MLGTKIWLSQELRDDLERFARSRTLAARLVQRAQIVLMAAARKSDQEIARAVGVVRQTVGLWRSRFVEHGIAGIEKDAPRSGRPRTITPARIDEIVRLTTQSISCRCHPLEHSYFGSSHRGESLDHRPNLAGARSEAAPGEEFQVE